MADLTKNINVGVDASGVKTGLQEATKSIKDFGKTVQDESNKGAGGVDRLGESVKKLGPATDSSMKVSTRAFQAWSAGVARYSTEVQAAGNKLKEFELKAQLKGFTPDMYKPQIEALRGVIAEQDRLRASNTNLGMSAAATAAALRNVPAQFTDIVVSLQSGQAPMTVLLQQGGQLKDMFGGVGQAAKAIGGYILGLVNPFTVAAAALAGFAVAALSAEKTLRTEASWQTYATATGRAVSLSVESFKSLRDEMALLPGVSKATAAAVIGDLATMRDLGTTSLKGIASIASDVAVLMRTDMPTAAKELGKAFVDPAKGVNELNSQLKIFSATQIAAIEALAKMGDKAGAQALMLDTLKQASSGLATQGLTPLQQATNNFGNAWDTAMKSLNGAGGTLRAVNTLMAGLVQHTADAVNWLSKLRLPKEMEDLFKGGLNGMVYGWIAGSPKPAFTGGASGGWGPSSGGASGGWSGPDANDETNAWNNRVAALRSATDRYKATSQQMADLRKNASDLSNTIAELVSKGDGQSELANKLRENLAGVNEQLATLAKRGEDRSGAAAIKKEINDYNQLAATIQGRIDLNKEEEKYSGTLNDAKKAEIKLDADLKENKLKLTEAHKADLRARLDIWKQQEEAKEQAKREVAAYKEQVAAQDEAAKAYVRLYDGMTKARLAIDALQTSTNNDTERLRLEATLIGGTNTQRRITLQIYDLQIARKKELQRLDETDFATAQDRTEAEQRINDIYDQRAENIKKSVNIEEWSATVKQIEDIFVNGFADMMNNGKSGWESFCKSLKTSFSTMVAKEIYAMFAKPFVVQLVGSFMGMLGGAGGLLGGLLGGSSSGGGLGGLMNLGSAANTGYGLYSGSTFTTAGSWMSSAGNYMGWDWLSNAGATVGGWGAASAAPYAAYGANYAAPATLGVVNVPGAASSPLAGMGPAGWAAAAVIIAAYLGGMFKDEKQVGQGITGELGGNLYGYQLMRESGGLFDGPDYRYVVAEKEIEKSKAEIERLKKEIADNPGDARNGYRERQLQQQYSRLEMLAQYNGSIEALSSPIKMLQDAFLTMREDTASRADSLKLDGDSIRAMKVTLGLDEIHPDTGGKGLELTGLTQEEASAKIQAALAQANEEMARSVLGTWQEQTREVTRMVWDNVELPSDGETQQFVRVGREVTDTVTEQVFVMSEYVRAGETAVQALTRLSDSLLSVNTVFDMLGVTLMDTSLAGADLASDIIDAFGGGDKFSAATSNYYDKFYSDQEKVQTQTRLLNEQLKKLGVETMPTSREALREYINGIDLSTEQGRKLYASLLGLVDVFDMIYTSAENIAGLKQDLNVQLLRAQGNDAEALRLEREKQIKELEKYKDPELVRMQREVWAAEDKTKADEEAKQAAEAAKALGMKNLEAAVAREKEYWNQFSADAKEALSKASSYFDLVTNAAKSLRESVEDGSSWAAAAGMVYIEQALANARNGGGLSDLDATKSAIAAATGGLVMDNYATQAELDYDKKVLAGQLDELGGYAELAKTDAQKQIDLANSQIKRLDDTLTFWKEYGEEQVDATLSVTDAVNALYKLLDPKEQERIRKEEAEKAGLGGGSAPGYTPTGGGSLGGTVAGSNRVTVVGLTADGRAIFSNGEIGQTPAGQTSYNSTGQMNSNGYSLAEFERFKTSGEFEWDAAKNQWRKRASFAIGTNYVPRDMTANIHQGERIIPAADNRALMAALGTQGGGNAELITAVKKLEERLASIDHNTASSAISGQRLDDNFNQVTEGGNGMRVVNPA